MSHFTTAASMDGPTLLREFKAMGVDDYLITAAISGGLVMGRALYIYIMMEAENA